METKHWLLLVSLIMSIVAFALSIAALMKTKKEKTEHYAAYPFGPIDPMNVNPLVTQSVFGQPSNYFQLSSNPQNMDTGAWQALQTAENLVNYVRRNPVEWTTNDTFNMTGNSDYYLLLANEPVGAWKNL